MSKKFPLQIPIFPLSGVIYFPKTNLPLNIFEQRYLNLVNDVIQKDKLMGMIQLMEKGSDVYKVGCLGKISDHKTGDDGKIIINLTGLIRFEIVKEVKNQKLYREFIVDYEKFHLDTKATIEKPRTESLIKNTKTFFEKNGISINWKEFEKLDIAQKINTLSMIAPIANEEKQKLLESISLDEKIITLQNIVNFYLHEVNFNNRTIQ